MCLNITFLKEGFGNIGAFVRKLIYFEIRSLVIQMTNLTLKEKQN